MGRTYGEQSEDEGSVSTPDPSSSSGEDENQDRNHEPSDTNNGQPVGHRHNMLVRLSHPSGCARREPRDQFVTSWMGLCFDICHREWGMGWDGSEERN